jgi:hypothetical protein
MGDFIGMSFVDFWGIQHAEPLLRGPHADVSAAAFLDKCLAL